MAIANLNAGGAGGNRPPVGAFFGKSAANDNMQKISSDFISKDVVSSVLDTIGGISAELKKVQQFSKDAIKGFERLVIDMRKLNNEITSKFSSVNTQIKKDNMDFLRSITTKASGGGEGLVAMGDASAPGATPEVKAKEADKEEEKKSFLDSMLDLANLADTAKDAFDVAKRYGPRLMQGARNFVGGVGLPLTALAGGMIALAYHRKQAQEADPEGAANFDRSIASGAKRAEVIQGPEADKNAPNANADIKPKKLQPADFLKENGIIPNTSPEEVKKVMVGIKGQTATLKDGRWWNTEEQILRNPDGTPAEKGPIGKPTNAADGNVQGSQQSFRVGGEEAKEGSPLSEKQMIAVNMALSMNPENAKQYPSWLMDQYNKQRSQKSGDGTPTPSAGPAYRLPGFKDLNESRSTSSGAATVTSGEAPAQTSAAPAAETGAPMRVSDIPPSAPPTDVPAEGNTPAAKEAGAPAPAAATAPAPQSKFLGSPSNIEEEDFSNLANVAGVSVEKGKDLPDKAMMALDAMMENDPQAAAKKYPAWVLEQYAKQNGNEAAPTGGATSQAAELAGENVAGGGGAGGGDNGGTGEPSADAGKTEGAPAPSAPSPPNVPADLEPPSQTNQDATPVVISNESSSSSGSVSNPEGNASSGQNLPMTAQNDALTEYFAKQNVEYQ